MGQYGACNKSLTKPYQLQTEAVSVGRGVVHRVVPLLVPDPWVGIVSQQVLKAPVQTRDTL